MPQDDGHFDAQVARTYDADHPTDPATLRATVETLRDLAGGGAVLEFASGTGRIALPLAAAGVPVSGIELSAPMTAILRAKPGGARIPVVTGDMTTARCPGTFALVVLAFNTIDNLTTQAAQCACFRNAAAHLAPGGRFVVETLVPPLQRLPPGSRRIAFASGPEHFGVDEIDVVSQTYTSHHIRLRGGVPQPPQSVPFRYAWPAELDLMAQMAGLAPEYRWADWHRRPFTAASTAHVSVWRKATRATEDP